jgi:isochorismate hydrolase
VIPLKSIRELIDELTPEQKDALIAKLRSAALKHAYEQAKLDNWEKYSNKPK